MPDFIPFAEEIIERNYEEAKKYEGLVSAMIVTKTFQEIVEFAKTTKAKETTKGFLEYLCFAHEIADGFKFGQVDERSLVNFMRAFKIAHFDEALGMNKSDNAKRLTVLAQSMMTSFEEVLTGFESRRLVNIKGFIVAAQKFFAFRDAFDPEEKEFMIGKTHQLLMMYFLGQSPETDPHVRDLRGMLFRLGGSEALAQLDACKLKMMLALIAVGRWPLTHRMRVALTRDGLVVEEADTDADDEAGDSDSDDEDEEEPDAVDNNAPVAVVIGNATPAA